MYSDTTSSQKEHIVTSRVQLYRLCVVFMIVIKVSISESHHQVVLVSKVSMYVIDITVPH